MYRTFKLAWTVASLIFALGVAYTHHDGSLYPGIAVGGALASCFLFLGILRSSSSVATIIFSFASLGAGYRIYSYLFPASMMRFDPDAYAVRSQIIIMTGSLSNLIDGFYHIASIFTIFGAETAVITGLSVGQAYVVFPVIISATAPLFAGVIIRQITTDTLPVASAVGAVTLNGALIQYSNGPIPITLAAVYLAAVLLVLVLRADNLIREFSILTFLFLVVGIFTHKIALLMIFGSLIIHHIFTTLLDQKEGRRMSTATLTISSGLLLTTQWTYITSYLVPAAAQIFEVFDVLSLSRVPLSDPTAVTRVDPPFFEKVYRISYYLISMLLGAAGGLVLFRRRNSQQVRLIQSVALGTAGITIPGIVIHAAPGFQRVYVFAAIPVAVLIGGLIAELSDIASVRTGLGVCILLLLILNPMAAVSTPDYQETPREYLTEAEVTAKEFGNEYVPGIVYADLFYGDESVNFRRAVTKDANQRQVPQPQWRPGLIDSGLKNGTLLSKGYQTIAYRTSVEIYRLTNGWYRLNWHPERKLAAQYHGVYDNGDVRIFNRP